MHLQEAILVDMRGKPPMSQYCPQGTVESTNSETLQHVHLNNSACTLQYSITSRPLAKTQALPNITPYPVCVAPAWQNLRPGIHGCTQTSSTLYSAEQDLGAQILLLYVIVTISTDVIWSLSTCQTPDLLGVPLQLSGVTGAPMAAKQNDVLCGSTATES
jgi:hypothetical protein